MFHMDLVMFPELAIKKELRERSLISCRDTLTEMSVKIKISLKCRSTFPVIYDFGTKKQKREEEVL